MNNKTLYNKIFKNLLLSFLIGWSLQAASAFAETAKNPVDATLNTEDRSQKRQEEWLRNDPFMNESWDPAVDVDRMRRRMMKFFQEYMPRGMTQMNLNGFEPDMDLQESETQYIVCADLPGMSKEAIHIEATENSILISGERKSEEVQAKQTLDGSVHRMERKFGAFSRTLSLLEPIKTDQIKAEYKEGVLTVTLPKVNPSKQKTGVKINVV